MRRLALLLIPLAVWGLALVVASCASDEDDQASAAKAPAGAPVVVMLLLDEFPVDALGAPGHIDAARFPHFAALANTSTWFPNTFAVHDETPYALPAIMDGRLPRRGRRASLAGHPRSIFTLLGNRRWGVIQSQEATDLCPSRLCPGAIARRRGILRNLARGRLQRFNHWMHLIKPRAAPTLYLKHSLVPHLPWVFLPSGRKVRVTLGHLANAAGFHDPGLTRHNEERFLLQLGYVDWQLGRLMRTLRRQGLFDRALIVVTADHGMSFDVGVNDRRRVSGRTIDDVLPVPFFLKAPSQTAGRVDRGFGRTVDIVPTIAGLLKLPLDWHADGRSRLAKARRIPRIVSMPDRFFHGVVSIRKSRLARRRMANAKRRARQFGTGAQSTLLFGSPWATVYRAGPRPGLVGRSLSGFSVRSGSVRARFAGGERWLRVKPRSLRVPTQVAGWIPGGTGAGRRLVAVSVGGHIQATGRTFRLRRGTAELFSLMVPESSLRRGRNRIELLEVTGGGRSPRLLRLARSS